MYVPPPIFSKDVFQRMFFKGCFSNALFCDEKCPFVQGNVAVNTKLISKVPFLFGNFDVFKINLVKNVQFLYGMSMV